MLTEDNILDIELGKIDQTEAIRLLILDHKLLSSAVAEHEEEQNDAQSKVYGVVEDIQKISAEFEEIQEGLSETLIFSKEGVREFLQPLDTAIKDATTFVKDYT